MDKKLAVVKKAILPSIVDRIASLLRNYLRRDSLYHLAEEFALNDKWSIENQ